MADVLENMLGTALDGLDRGDRKRIAEIKRLDDVLDRLNSAIKAYLTSLDPDAIDYDDDCKGRIDSIPARRSKSVPVG
jgi:phosphate:Na+ symporter